MLKQIMLISAMVAFLTFGLTAHAEELLTTDQIKELVTGKTVQAKHLKKDFTFTVYFDTDGKTAIRKQKGDEVTTTYRIEGNRHCLFWKGADRCATIKKNGDGSYVRINPKGVEMVKWIQFENGNKL